MNEQELRQYCANATGAELATLFRNVEVNYSKIWPYAERYVQLTSERDEKAKQQTECKQMVKGSMWLTILLGVAAVGLFVLSAGANGLGDLILKFLGIGAIICALSGLVTMIIHKAKTIALAKEVPELTRQAEEVEAQMNQVKKQYHADMLIRQWVFPEGCASPQRMRYFVNLFETGRATTLKEGYLCYDEQMHRERMEQMAAQQVSSARAAEAAAYQAMHAAQSAEATANQAKNSADWAAYNSRYNQ